MPGGGIARPAGSPATIEVDGETLILAPFSLEDWGAAENYLRERKQDRIVGIAARQRGVLPDDVWQQKYDEAVKRAEAVDDIEPDKVAQWIDTDDGLAWMLWWMIEKHPGQHGKVPLTKMRGIVTADRAAHEFARIERMKRARDKAATIDEPSKNVTGPTTLADVAGHNETEGKEKETELVAGGISSGS